MFYPTLNSTSFILSSLWFCCILSCNPAIFHILLLSFTSSHISWHACFYLSVHFAPLFLFFCCVLFCFPYHLIKHFFHPRLPWHLSFYLHPSPPRALPPFLAPSRPHTPQTRPPRSLSQPFTLFFCTWDLPNNKWLCPRSDKRSTAQEATATVSFILFPPLSLPSQLSNYLCST